MTPEKGYVLFETGYGPSGLPHIGTFGEVARTSMLRHAFGVMCDIPSRLVAFSDDMDGLRGVPGNLPEQDMLRAHLGKPLTKIPDPFGTHESLGQHNNARLCAFLDSFGFDYEFMSSTTCYASGMFDEMLLNVLRHYDAIMAFMLPTLRDERRATFSPVLPISPQTGNVLQVPIIAVDADARHGRLRRRGRNQGRGAGHRRAIASSAGRPTGRCAGRRSGSIMRWPARTMIDSIKHSSEICRILGATPPEGFNYELFLDDQGQKISKSKGNGLTIDEWLRYGTRESLSLFMYNSPRKAKRLYFDVIPRHVDDYASHLENYAGQVPEKRLGNPVWHIHDGKPPAPSQPISFGVLLNLASVANAEDKSVLWGYIARYVPDASPESAAMLDELAGHARQLLPRLRQAEQKLPRAQRRGARGARGPGDRARGRSPTRRKRSSTRSTRSASATVSSRCAPGSRRSTRRCSASRRGRAWARSSRSTAAPRREPLSSACWLART